MRVRVLYFASLRDRAGVREEALTIPAESTVADLKGVLGTRHGSLAPALQSALVSINREFALPEESLSEGDEVAIFPPVSGGAATPPTRFQITEAPLDLNALLEDIVLPSTGAACVFTGIVRGRTERGDPHDTDHLEYEAYTPMAEAKMKQVADEIRERWPTVEGIAIVQRIGHLEPGTPTVLIACTAAHRDTGVFEAARYGIDRLKQIVPIWKKEVSPEGEVWVEGDYHPGERDKSG
jgi:molybdopterin converting factor subunit 1